MLSIYKWSIKNSIRLVQWDERYLIYVYNSGILFLNFCFYILMGCYSFPMGNSSFNIEIQIQLAYSKFQNWGEGFS